MTPTPNRPQIIDLDTTEGMIAWTKTMTDDQLVALADSKAIAHIVIGMAAEGELILRGVR